MNDTVWICFNERGATRMVKRTTARPALKVGEYAVLVELKVPETVFTEVEPAATLNVQRRKVIKASATTVEAE